jgi:hypothetical protein
MFDARGQIGASGDGWNRDVLGHDEGNAGFDGRSEGSEILSFHGTGSLLNHQELRRIR